MQFNEHFIQFKCIAKNAAQGICLDRFLIALHSFVRFGEALSTFPLRNGDGKEKECDWFEEEDEREF